MDNQPLVYTGPCSKTVPNPTARLAPDNSIGDICPCGWLNTLHKRVF